MRPRRHDGPPKPLTADSLRWFAMRYVERYATSRGRLRDYLRRKLREKGWAGEGDAPIDATVERMAELGFVDDRAYGEARARGLERRGFGARRVGQVLTVAGLDAELREEIGESVDSVGAAIAFARRRRFGPFARDAVPPEQRQKHFAAMMRAGHAPRLVKAVLGARDEAALDDIEA